MKIMKRVGEQVNMMKKVGGHSLKFILGIWNSKFGISTYLHVKVNFERLYKINFEETIIISKLRSQESNALNDIQIEIETKKL